MTTPSSRPPVPPPADMSTAEKLAAEWEARHDVLARGHRADPLVLQQYLAHARTEEAARRGTIPAPRRPRDADAHRPTTSTTPTAPAGGSQPSGGAATDPAPAPAGARRRPWWRRLRDR
ncbi:hypothetical protein [Trujillonella endophytica]|uniref:Uncharacterized protein n=1 Tax=Trujillonella endophytica TaxID=673521 RepID=A0A1H8SYI8_9ACTN|nr:hypothetical protein [Trujillella endophytica]SEO83263.1 hypothetical protein SAMN05660991_01900 [Trujillella endophytica]